MPTIIISFCLPDLQERGDTRIFTISINVNKFLFLSPDSSQSPTSESNYKFVSVTKKLKDGIKNLKPLLNSQRGLSKNSNLETKNKCMCNPEE
jgi:hypothetical protein